VPGPRIIVFTVSGVIEGDITITHGDVTIAGQTAPGGGITIRGRLFAEYDPSVTNIIARFLRVRPAFDGSAGDQFDGAQLSLNSRLILDHMTLSWGVDETVDLYEADDVTIQWSTIEESATEGHPEGEHNYGLINGPDGHNIAVHHNLFAHHKNRNPAIANGPAEVRNNVAYNVRHGFVHHNPPAGPFNIVGNTYIKGPDDELFPFFFDDDGAGPGPMLSYYLADNSIDDPGVFVGVVENPWTTPFAHPSFEYLSMPESFRSDKEHDFSGVVMDYVPVTTQPSMEAYALVLEKAGAFPRDVVTTRIIDEVKTKGGSWGVHEPADFMEGLTPEAPPADGDNDGMADAWETENGLDPQNGGDHNKEMPSGYTAIEDYINGLGDKLTGGVPGGGGAGGGGPGPGGTSASGSGATGGTGAGGAGGAGANPPGADGGCSCGVAGDASPWAAGAAIAALGFGFASRRRRRS
jgi:MYXO-CTERM domain-containing protein